MSRFPSSVRFEYDEAHSSNFTPGKWRKDFIVIHHWDDPAKRPQFGGVVSWFKNPSANVSIQYMVEAGRIAQMIPESAMAWHAGNSTANRHGIGIELNPRQYDGDYETAAQLVAEIWDRRGKLPLRKHREFFGTSCPGTWDVSRIQRRAEQIYSGTTTAGNVLEGEVMTTPYELWAYKNDDVDTRQTYTMLRNAASDVLWDRTYDYANPDGDPTSLRHQVSRAHQYSLGAMTLSDRRLDYINSENPTTARHQIARAHQYAMNASQRAREANEKIDAVAEAVAALVGQIDQNTRKALEDKLAAIKTESARANAAEVDAELEVSVKEED